MNASKKSETLEQMAAIARMYLAAGRPLDSKGRRLPLRYLVALDKVNAR